MKTTRRKKGLYDSSITRVWPVFQPLLRRDPSGLSWLPRILALAPENQALARRLGQALSPLLPACLGKRPIRAQTLRQFGKPPAVMEACFERSLPPSAAFLRWLIHNPDRLNWPRQGKEKYSSVPQARREALLGLHTSQAQAAAQAEALAELERVGAEYSHGKWWGFEGVSFADCCLETAGMVLLIEGKRTESLSSRIHWYPERSQLLRNLEVTGELAGARDFAVLVIAEEPIQPPTAQVIERSLPHFTPAERAELMQHYLGCLTWRQVCQATGVTYADLPDTVADWNA